MRKRIVSVFIISLIACFALICGCAEKINVDEGTTPSSGPVISNLGPAWITVNTTSVISDIISLEVSWTTDVPSTTKLIYYFGSDESGTMNSTEETTLTLTHTVEIIVGSPEFCYRAASRNAAGKETISALDSPVVYVSATSEMRDTYLDQSVPLANYGPSPTLNVGDGGGFEFRALLTFEAASHVPSNRTIDNAALILMCSNPGIAPANINVYAEVDPIPWLELASAWSSPVGGPPWTFPFNPIFAVPAGGGSFLPGPVLVATMLVVGPGPWYIGNVKAALLPPSNGLLLARAALPAPGDVKTFFSREGAVPPMLKLYLVKTP